ncbi:IS110 family transposase [Conchiformibius kuhniae]|uniref:IS110 family transposase n=6 Tax=Conchiformibius kuhniae TaxID=211502 RepID=A0A8T9MXF8_9NEIS|nr:IS110 family transposase [Conchiformibius kuhniae]UOP05555.1 IS110 family transposase [Conchiformibius kuhniae]UOP05594.1 IS110 family transposase [Conchiformibius kuhniae]
MMHYLGIDVSKDKLDICWLKDPAQLKIKTKVLPNTPKGLQQLQQWLDKNLPDCPKQRHICMEATGIYHEAAAYFLHDCGYRVSVINPAHSRDFAKASGSIHKTDKADSMVLARYGAALQPAAWQPEAPEVRQLKALIARIEALQTDLQREQNRLEKALIVRTPLEVEQSIKQMIASLNEEIARLQGQRDDHIDRHPQLKQDIKLLRTIPGIGMQTAVRICALYRSRNFTSAAQMAAFVGLVPKMHESGQQRGRVMLSKKGSAVLRAALYLPAVVSKKYNPDIAAQYARLLQRQKTPMQALGAAMRKLVHICFGVLKHQTVYQSRQLEISATGA